MNTSTISLAFGSLRRQKRRTVLTMLAIAIGIAMVIIIMAAGRGLERFVLGQLDTFGPDSIAIEVRVPTAKKNSPDFGAVGIVITTLKDRDLKDILRHPNIAAAYGMVSGQELASYQGEAKKIMTMGHGAGLPEVEKVELDDGRFYTKEEEDSLAAVAVLGSKAKEKLFGDDVAVDKTIYIRGKPFRVVGVQKPRGSAFFFDMDNMINLPTKTMQKKMLGIDYMQMIIARMRDGALSKQTTEELAETIRLNHGIVDPERDDFVVNSTADAQEILKTVTGGITMLLVALVCLSLIVGGVGIMNIMYVSVAERTFEIGLRKAVGATSQDILKQFLSEAILVTTSGGVVGVVLGIIVAFFIYLLALSFNFKWVFSVPLFAIVLAVSFSAFIGVLFGYYPARRAANLRPIEALRRD